MVKFNAWHKEESRMGEVYQLDLKDGFVELKFPDRPLAEIYPIERVILLQHIGLKEWYDGDILGLKDPEDTSKCVIEYHAPSFKRKYENPDFFIDFDVKLDVNEWHKIGNIYENPELIKG